MSSRRRAGVIAALTAAHAAVIAALALGAPGVAVATPHAIAVTEIRTAAPPLAVVELKLATFAVTVDPPVLPADGDSVAKVAAAPQAVVGGTGCALNDQVQAALRASPAVKAALAAMPRTARSVADAMLLWDGHWADAAQLGGAGVATPIRATVAAALRSAPADCLAAPIAGPRFLFVPADGGTRVIALGSGEWSWSQVVEG